MPDSIAVWARNMAVNLANERAWARHSSVRPWLATCLLNASAAWGQIPAEDAASHDLVIRVAKHMKPAIDNLRRITTDTFVEEPA